MPPDSQVLLDWLEYASACLEFLRRKFRIPSGDAVLEGIPEDAVMALLKKHDKQEKVEFPKTYLRNTVRNLLYKNLRRGKLVTQIIPPSDAALPAELTVSPAPYEPEEEKPPMIRRPQVSDPRAAFILACLGRLPAALRRVATLRLVDNLDREEIARKLKCSDATVRRYCTRAAARVAEMVFEDEELKMAVLRHLCPRI